MLLSERSRTLKHAVEEARKPDLKIDTRMAHSFASWKHVSRAGTIANETCDVTGDSKQGKHKRGNVQIIAGQSRGTFRVR